MDLRDARPVAAALLIVLGAAVLALSQVEVRQAPEGNPAEASSPDGQTFVDYQDEIYGFRIRIPETWDRTAVHDAVGKPDYALAFAGDPPEGRIEVSIWDADPDRASLTLWMGVTVGALEPVGGTLPNAEIGGRPAAVVWQPTAVGRGLAAFAEHNGDYLRVRFTPGDSPTEIFRVALASLSWADADAPNQIPALNQAAADVP